MPDPFDSKLTPLEASLARLVPRAEGLSRERMLFEAGRSSAGPGRLWPALASLSSLAAVVLAGLLLTRGPRVIVEERIVVRTREVPVPAASGTAPEPDPPAGEISAPTSLPENEYLRLREGMLLWGMDALPPLETSTAAEPPLTPADLLAHKPPHSVLSLLPERPSRLETVP